MIGTSTATTRVFERKPTALLPDARPTDRSLRRWLQPCNEGLAAWARGIAALAEATNVDEDVLQLAVDELAARACLHFDTEERELLSVYAESEPEEVGELMAEHAALRAILNDLVHSIDQKGTRAERLAVLVAQLEAHAAREREGLYSAI